MLDTANTVLSQTASNGANPAVDAEFKEIFRYFTVWGLGNNEVNIDEASQFYVQEPHQVFYDINSLYLYRSCRAGQA
jgi:hypothetical protein